MLVKLRAVGNSVGVTIPASELRTIGARAGDTIELQIKKVVRNVRAGWSDAALWAGAYEEPLLLHGAAENPFDTQEWKW